MKAAVYVKAGAPLEIRDYPAPEPGPDTAVVELIASGVCGTDVHIHDGAIPFGGPIILGHEFIGRVAALGAGGAFDCTGQPLSVGNRVAVNVIEACGHCMLCCTGGAASCLNLGASLTYTRSADDPPHLHGGYAEATFCPTRYLHRLPENLPTDVAAAFLCAGPTVLRGLAYAGGIAPGDRVVVQGSGPVGLFAALCARALGAGSVALIGSGSNPLRLLLAAGLGADPVLDIRASTPAVRRAAVLDQTGGLGADLVIEGTGAPDAVAEGIELLRPRGRYVWAGQYSNRGPVAIAPHAVTFNALQLFGSAQFTVEDRVNYFDLLLKQPDRWEDIRRVVTHRYPVEQANDALEAARSGAAVKALLVRNP